MATSSNFVVKNGLTVGTTAVINSSGAWVGSPSGLLGATGPTGVTGSTGATGVGSTGATGILTPWIIISANTTATGNTQYIANTFSGLFYLTLPASPGVGSTIVITDGYNFGSNNLIILRNGSTIAGYTDNVALNLSNTVSYFTYDGGTWRYSTTAGALGATGATGIVAPFILITANTTATGNTQYLANTLTSGAFTLTLPASPNLGTTVTVSDAGNFGANNLTIARNGSTIDGIADNIALNLPGIFAEWVYDGTSWRTITTAGSQGATGATGSGATGSTGATGALPLTTPFTANGVVYASNTSTLATGSALKFDGTNLTTTGSVNSTNTFGFKNRIINGGMVIDQRNAGATVSAVVNNVYLVDRMKFTGSATVSGKFNFAQNLNSVTPPVGFKYYSGFQTGTALTVGSVDLAVFEQLIEGYNVADLMFGTASAKAFTISCWVYSSLTGTFGGCLKDSGYSYSYPFTYSIPTANTWTYITINVTAPTGGSWSTTNAVGLRVLFGLGVGTGASGTANNTWQAGDYYSATGAVSVIGTTSATWYVTGFQVEVGTQATSFDFRSIGTELALCQRYYEMIGDVLGGSTVQILFVDTYAPAGGSTTAQYNWSYKQQKRAVPTVAIYGSFSTSNITGSLGTLGISPTVACLYGSPIAAGRLYWYNNAASGWYASAEL